MFTTINAPEGSATIDGEYGNIVGINGDWKDGEAPRQFRVGEYRSFYGVLKLPQVLDIGNIGYTREDGVTVPPADAWRSLEVITRQGNSLPQRYIALSMGKLDVLHLASDDHLEKLHPVHDTDKISVWYAPEGFYSIHPDLGLLFNRHRDGSTGQLLVRARNSAVYWHVVTMPHHALYAKTSFLLRKEEHLLLYLSRRAPVFSLDAFASGLAEIAQESGLTKRDILLHQQDSIMKALPLLCPLCGEEADTLHKTPDEKGVCAACLAAHYSKCGDCGKVILRKDMKYDAGDALCSDCLRFGKGMGFR